MKARWKDIIFDQVETRRKFFYGCEGRGDNVKDFYGYSVARETVTRLDKGETTYLCLPVERMMLRRRKDKCSSVSWCQYTDACIGTRTMQKGKAQLSQSRISASA